VSDARNAGSATDLLRALLLRDEHLELWQRNAVFRAGMQTFVDMLPFFVDGLAAEARRRGEEFDRNVEVLMRESPLDLQEIRRRMEEAAGEG
jgi:hypothetical protein